MKLLNARTLAFVLTSLGVCTALSTDADALPNCPPGSNAPICNGGVKKPPPPPPPLIVGNVNPKFMIYSVIYAPPGSAVKGAGSSVDYGSGSTAGVTTSATSSFKNDISLTASLSLGLPVGPSAQIDVTQTGSNTTSNTNSFDVKKSTNQDIKVPGSATDGVDHGGDEIWLWLNPSISMKVSADGKSATQSLGINPNTPAGNAVDLQFVFLSELQNPSTMRAAVASTLAAHGITTADYATMLARDPFAGGAPNLASSRFVQTPTTFPYEAPRSSSDPAQPFTFTADNSSTTTVSATASDSYALGISVTGSLQFASWEKGSLKIADTMTWTDSSTQTTTSTATQHAAVTVASPSTAFTGFSDIAVYVDTMYNTFIFSPIVNLAPSLTGVVTNKAGQPVAHTQVLVTAGGKQHRTFTDATGTYRVYGASAGAAQVAINGIAHAVTIAGRTTKSDIKLAQ